MDNDAGISEVQRSDGNSRSFRDLGLRILEPLDPMKMNREKLIWLWDNMKRQDYAFDDFCRGDASVFAQQLGDPGSFHFLAGDYGYATVRNLAKSDNGYMHWVSFKKVPFRHVVEAGRELVNFMFRHCGVARLTAPTPAYIESAKKFAVLLGFKYEGELRKAIVYFEKHYSVYLYGLLREEWEVQIGDPNARWNSKYVKHDIGASASGSKLAS